MNLIIVGSMGAGKTTLSKLLAKQYKVEHIQICEYRRKYNKKKTERGELLAKQKFIEKITYSKKDLIVEVTGYGQIWKDVLYALEVRPFLIIKCNCSIRILLNRMKTRIIKKYINFLLFLLHGPGFSNSYKDLQKSVYWIDKNIIAKPNFTVDTGICSIPSCMKQITDFLALIGTQRNKK